MNAFSIIAAFNIGGAAAKRITRKERLKLGDQNGLEVCRQRVRIKDPLFAKRWKVNFTVNQFAQGGLSGV